MEMNAKVEYHTDLPSEIWKLKKALDEEFAPEIDGLGWASNRVAATGFGCTRG